MSIIEKTNIAQIDARTGGEPRAKFRLAARFLGLEQKVAAAIPHGIRVYAVGDIHGRLDLLQKLWAQIEADAEGCNLDKLIIFIGDYVDRGPSSKGVIDFLLQSKLERTTLICLRGNHDQAVLDFFADSKLYRNWKDFGAPETLMSYGVMPPRFDNEIDFERARAQLEQDMPPRHLKFLNELPYSHVVGDYVFAHAGIRPGIPLEKQDPHDLLWIRDEFLDSRTSFGKIVVHGHSHVESPMRRSNRIAIDTGAYATGHLTAVVLEETNCRFLTT